jgi:hypothetical protein
MIMHDIDTMPCQDPSVISETVGGELYLFNPKNGALKKTNDVGTLIWSLCDGKCSIDDAVKAITSSWNIDPGTARNDLLTFINQLKSEGFVTEDRTTEDNG